MENCLLDPISASMGDRDSSFGMCEQVVLWQPVDQ